MRCSSQVLFVTRDERLVQAASLEIYARSPLAVVVAGSVDDGLRILDDLRPCAVVVHLEGVTDEEVAQVLWAASVAPRALPVLAVADDYDDERARTLFRLGVTDCLDRGSHLTRLAELLAAVVPQPEPTDEAGVELGAREDLLATPRLSHERDLPPVAPQLPGLHRFTIRGEG